MNEAESQTPELEGVFRECAQDLRAYFARRHGSPEAADDLVQETFLQLARRLRGGEKVCSPRAYLFGIARYVSLAFFRKHGALEPLDETTLEEAVGPEPDAQLEAAREIIASLPSLQREILDLRFAHDLSYAEIALALCIPVGTVRSRLHNAVALVRQRLEADEAESTPPGAPALVGLAGQETTQRQGNAGRLKPAKAGAPGLTGKRPSPSRRQRPRALTPNSFCHET
jgi:RNA polymerase sigma-70 factor (ECF subfamily)